jgi:hypothetical protein
VVLGDADSLGSTHYGVTGGDTLLQSEAAHFFFRALGIRLALVFGDERTSGSVIWVSVVTFKTLAESLVIAGTALRVLWTGEQLTDGCTSEDTE